MKQAAQSDSRQAQDLASGPARTTFRPQAFAPGGHLVQLAGLMNGGPREKPLAQLKDDLQQSSRVQNLARLSAEINRGSPAQLRGVDPGLEHAKASPHAQGAELQQGPVPEEHLPYDACSVAKQNGSGQGAMQMKQGDHAGGVPDEHVHGLGNFPGIVQRTKVTTVASYQDPDDGKTYEFDDIFEMDLSGLMAAGIDQDDPGLDTFTKILKGTKLKYVQEGNAQAVADITEVLKYFEDPRSSKFSVAAPGKRLGSSAADFASIKATVDGILESRKDYGEVIAKTRDTYPDSGKLKSLKILKNFVTPFTGIRPKVLQENAQLTDEVITLFSWMIPLHTESIKAIDNKQSLMYRIKICLAEKIGLLQSKATGALPLPTGSLIRYGATKTVGDYPLATQSAIKTAYLGAQKSGEESTARNLESALSEYYETPFVAGHLVADSLGGKNVSDNLAPFTNSFNTNGGKQGIKDPENDALKRLKAGQVIFYSTTVSYGNAEAVNWRLAVQPTRVQVRVTTLLLAEDGDPTQIADYKQVTDEEIYVLSPPVKTKL